MCSTVSNINYQHASGLSDFNLVISLPHIQDDMLYEVMGMACSCV